MQYLCLLLTPFCFLVAGPAVVASPTAKVRSSSNPACTTNTALQELQQNSVSALSFLLHLHSSHDLDPHCFRPQSKADFVSQPRHPGKFTLFSHAPLTDRRIYRTSSITSTATATYTVYPGGRHLESISIAPFVDNEPATLVSSACSCLSLAAPTTTITASESTVVSPGSFLSVAQLHLPTTF